MFLHNAFTKQKVEQEWVIVTVLFLLCSNQCEPSTASCASTAFGAMTITAPGLRIVWERRITPSS